VQVIGGIAAGSSWLGMRATWDSRVNSATSTGRGQSQEATYCATTPSGAVAIWKAAAISALV
jgi:hypothetical protein